MSYTLIRNGTLIDGTGKAPITNAALLVKENRIHSVGRAETISLPNESIHEIDAGGGFILPGFIDTHVHLMLEA